MKKDIILSNGKIENLEFNERFIEMYKALAINILKKYKNGLAISEDENQELDIIIYETFLEYKPVNKFSTFLVWKVKGYGAKTVSRAIAKKRNTKNYKIVNLDAKITSDKNGGSNYICEFIKEEKFNLEEIMVEKIFTEYLTGNLNEIEIDLLKANLKLQSLKLVGEKYNKSKSNISNYNFRFKKKLKLLLSEFNK